MAGMDRKFETGAVRDLDNSKLDFEGFISPVVTLRFAQYMHKNRFREVTGEMRAGDNWQLGIPKEAYAKSLARHVHDVMLHHDGYGHLAAEDLETALCGVLFNTQGYLFEVLRARVGTETTVPVGTLPGADFGGAGLDEEPIARHTRLDDLTRASPIKSNYDGEDPTSDLARLAAIGITWPGVAR